MFHSEKEFMFHYGWDGYFESQCPDYESQTIVPARIINEERNLYRAQWGFNKTIWASVTGKLQFKASSRLDFPAVGDWVLLEIPPQSNRGVILEVLPRKSLIQRKQIGSGVDLQILSTNVDYIFITTSITDELNYRRIERYLTMAWESGAVPIIILTKADLFVGNINDLLTEIKDTFLGVDVFTTSKNELADAQFFSNYLQTGKTAVVVGSSGVGKSTLVNFLIGDEEIKTQEVRKCDGKGRHTTTSRSLYQSRYGGLIIDTPGMRELQLLDHADGIQIQFSDIENLIKNCRFGNCQHLTEPNCAIKSALQDESLSEERWQSYQKMGAEIRHSLRKRDKIQASEDRKQWKKISQRARKDRRCKIGGM